MLRNIPTSTVTVLRLTIVVQLLSHVLLFEIPWTAARQASLSSTISLSLLKCMSIESVLPSNRLNFCHPLLLPSVFPSIRVFSNELSFQWPKYQSFIISPSSEYSGLISFRMDWFDLLADQGTLKSSPAPLGWHQFFSAQPYLWSNSHIHT